MTSPRQPARRGFTLVELLVTIAIIAVLASLVFAVLGRVGRQGDRAVAVSQYKQIGLAIAAVAAENNSALPRSIFPGQVPSYSTDKPERLVMILADHLSIQPGQASTDYVDIFTPPAFRKTAVYRSYEQDANQPRTIVANFKVLKEDQLIAPFGSAIPGALTDPMKLSDVPDPQGNWALSDADQLHPHVIPAAWRNFTASQPFHGDKRVALFFDWHVELREQEFFNIPVPAPSTP